MQNRLVLRVCTVVPVHTCSSVSVVVSVKGRCTQCPLCPLLQAQLPSCSVEASFEAVLLIRRRVVILSFLCRWRLFDVALCPWKYIDRQEINGTVACGFSLSDSPTFTTYQRSLRDSSHVTTSFSALCRTEGTLTIFTRAHHCPVYWARWIQLPLYCFFSTPLDAVLGRMNPLCTFTFWCFK